MFWGEESAVWIVRELCLGAWNQLFGLFRELFGCVKLAGWIVWGAVFGDVGSAGGIILEAVFADVKSAVLII